MESKSLRSNKPKQTPNVKKAKELALVIRNSLETQLHQNHKYFSKDLCGACGLASYTLYNKLTQLDIESSLIFGYFKKETNSHCWVEIDDYIIDITATQFGVKHGVYVLPKSKKYQEVTKIDDLRYFKFWRYLQNPINYNIEWNEFGPVFKIKRCNYLY